MKEEFTKDGYCNCGSPKEWIKDTTLPITYFEEMNEYGLKYGTKDNIHYKVMYYCFFCGGKLPDSNRDQYFLEMDESEERDLLSIVHRISTESDMKEVLGEPDTVFPWPAEEDRLDQKAVDRWAKQFTYNSRWKTITVVFSLYQDGRVEMGYHRKYVGKNKHQE